MPSLVEIGPVVLEKKSKIGKVYRRTDRQTDGQTDRRRTKGDQRSSLELSAQVSLKTNRTFYESRRCSSMFIDSFPDEQNNSNSQCL